MKTTLSESFTKTNLDSDLVNELVRVDLKPQRRVENAESPENAEEVVVAPEEHVQAHLDVIPVFILPTAHLIGQSAGQSVKTKPSMVLHTQNKHTHICTQHETSPRNKTNKNTISLMSTRSRRVQDSDDT